MCTRHFILLCLCALCSLSLSAREIDPLFGDTIDRTADDFVIASVCVADPTDWRDDFFGVWGHAWIRLQCPTFDMDYCYSYENERIEDNLWRFFTNDLNMGMFVIPTQEYVQDYMNWHRRVREFKLNISPASKQRLWEILDNKVAAGKLLKFDLIRRGCTFTVVKYVTEAIKPDTITYSSWPDIIKMNRRDILMQALDDYPWHKLLFKFYCPKIYEERCSNEDKLVLAALLAETWQYATINDLPLMEYVGDLSSGDNEPVQKIWFTPTMCLVIIVVLILCIAGVLVLRRNRS